MESENKSHASSTSPKEANSPGQVQQYPELLMAARHGNLQRLKDLIGIKDAPPPPPPAIALDIEQVAVVANAASLDTNTTTKSSAAPSPRLGVDH